MSVEEIREHGHQIKRDREREIKRDRETDKEAKNVGLGIGIPLGFFQKLALGCTSFSQPIQEEIVHNFMINC